MAFVQKIPQAQFTTIPQPGKVWATINGERLLCDFKGRVIVLDKLPKDREYQVFHDSLENGYAWVNAADVEQAEE